MYVTNEQVLAMAKSKPNASNLTSIMMSLDAHGAKYGLDKPHRIAHYLAQIMHESGDFKYDKEIWGPTAAQKKYDGRTDLGNTPAIDGDGKLFMGRTAMQLTGKANYQQFYGWCKGQGLNPPDFISKPELVNTDPWEGLVPLWYWTTRDLNKWADQNDIETITKKINGGKNGLEDRLDRYSRVGLVLLGYKPDDVMGFQTKMGMDSVDGDAGPKTRAAIHSSLVALVPGEAAKPSVKAAPVTEEKAVAVTPPSLDKPWWQSKELLVPVLTGGGLTGASTFMEKFGSVPWQNLIAILVFASVGMAAFMLYLRRNDQKTVAKQTNIVEG